MLQNDAPSAGGRLGAGSSGELTADGSVAERAARGERGRGLFRRLAINGCARLAWALWDIAERLR
jgi:hypothetical protein